MWIHVFSQLILRLACFHNMWPTATNPAVSAGKWLFRFADAENDWILSSKMMHHLSYSLKVSPMKSQYFPWKLLCCLLIWDTFIGLYRKKCSANLQRVFVRMGHIFQGVVSCLYAFPYILSYINYNIHELDCNQTPNKKSFLSSTERYRSINIALTWYNKCGCQIRTGGMYMKEKI